MDINVSKTPDELAGRAAEWVLDSIYQHQQAANRPYILSLAGGSTPRALYQCLALANDKRIDWQQVILIWGDERNVDREHPDSNYRMAMESLIKLPIPSHNILAVPDPGGDALRAAAAYESELRQRLPINSAGWGIANCILLGLGEDVHTASLFPDTTALAERHAWAVANYVAKLSTWRITLTAPLINAAEHVVFLVSGRSKQAALNQLFHGPIQPHQYPAQLIHPNPGKLTFLVDQSAIEGVEIV